MRWAVLWDLWCALTIVGIWPRWIEPQILQTTHLRATLPGLGQQLRLLQISDLHLSAIPWKPFLQKLSQRIRQLQPDILVITGDFLCKGKLDDHEEAQLESFLKRLEATYGLYCCFGNHDYEHYLTLNSSGDYDIQTTKEKTNLATILSRLTQKQTLTGNTTEQAKKTPPHPRLLKLLERTGITPLHNRSMQIPTKKRPLTLCGVGEHMGADIDLETTFGELSAADPIITLAHNPDSIASLIKAPPSLILSGHTHGYQVNLPFIRSRTALMEKERLARGLHHHVNGSWHYITRGIAGVIPFRWFSPPEIVCFDLQDGETLHVQ